MNFLDFITFQQSKIQDGKEEIVKKEKQEKIKKEKLTTDKSKKERVIIDKYKKEKLENVKKDQDVALNNKINQPTFMKKEYFRKGDFVTIVRMENSNMNVYKGYKGEIYDYTKNSDYALVIIDCLNASPIRMHVNHLIKRKT